MQSRQWFNVGTRSLDSRTNARASLWYVTITTVTLRATVTWDLGSHVDDAQAVATRNVLAPEAAGRHVLDGTAHGKGRPVTNGLGLLDLSVVTQNQSARAHLRNIEREFL